MKRIQMKEMKGVVALAAVLAACGDSNGSSSSSASVTGSISGQTLNAQEALSMLITSGGTCVRPFGGLTNAAGALIWISDHSGTCGLNAATCSVQANALTLAIVPWVAVTSGTPPALTPGTFAVNLQPGPVSGTATGAFAQAFATGAACGLAAGPTATAGSVTLISVNGSTLNGSFDLTLSDGSTVSGSFSTVNCSVNTAPICTETLDCTGALQCV